MKWMNLGMMPSNLTKWPSWPSHSKKPEGKLGQHDGWFVINSIKECELSSQQAYGYGPKSIPIPQKLNEDLPKPCSFT